ncbi:MAG: hypothetical protein ACKO5F_13435 [Synechococcus sp.]
MKAAKDFSPQSLFSQMSFQPGIFSRMGGEVGVLRVERNAEPYGAPLIATSEMKPFNHGLSSLQRQQEAETPQVVSGREELFQNIRQSAVPAPPAAQAPSAPTSDPYEAIRKMDFTWGGGYRPITEEEWAAAGGSYIDENGESRRAANPAGSEWVADGDYGLMMMRDEGSLTSDWERLRQAGFLSKYNAAWFLPDGRIAVTLQQPGAHKYDTMTAVYCKESETGQWVLQNDPMEYKTRQTSSLQSDYVDPFEEFVGSFVIPAASMYFGGTMLAGAGAGAGATGGLSGYLSGVLGNQVAGNIAAKALIQGGLGGVSAELQGGNFGEGFRRGALTGAAGALTASVLGPLGQASNAAVGGGQLGNIVGKAVTGASTAALGTAMRGGDGDEILESFGYGALDGGVTAGLPVLSQTASQAVGGGTLGMIVGRAVQSGGTAALGTAMRGGDGDEILESFGYGALDGGVTAGLPSLSQAASDAVGGGTFGTVVGHAVTSGFNAALATAVQGGDGEAILESLGIGALNGGLTAIKESLDSGALGGGTSAGGFALNGQPELPAPTSPLLPDMAPGADNEAVINQLADQGLGELVPYPAHHNTDLSIQNGMMATVGIGNLFRHEQAPPNGGGGREQESPNFSTMLGEGGERSLSAIDPITGSGLIHSRQEDSHFILREAVYTQWPESISRIDITGRHIAEDSAPIAPNTDWLGQQSSRPRGGWPNSERHGKAWEASRLYQPLVFNSRSAKGEWGIGVSLPTTPASRSWGPLAAETALGTAGARFSPMEVRAGSWLQNISELAIA